MYRAVLQGSTKGCPGRGQDLAPLAEQARLQDLLFRNCLDGVDDEDGFVPILRIPCYDPRGGVRRGCRRLPSGPVDRPV